MCETYDAETTCASSSACCVGNYVCFRVNSTPFVVYDAFSASQHEERAVVSRASIARRYPYVVSYTAGRYTCKSSFSVVTFHTTKIKCKKYFYSIDLDLNSIQGVDNLELIFKILHPHKATVISKNNSNLEITKNQIIWKLNQGQINSLEFSYWSLNKLLIGISFILVTIILAYLLRFYRFKIGTDLPQLPSN